MRPPVCSILATRKPPHADSPEVEGLESLYPKPMRLLRAPSMVMESCTLAGGCTPESLGIRLDPGRRRRWRV